MDVRLALSAFSLSALMACSAATMQQEGVERPVSAGAPSPSVAVKVTVPANVPPSAALIAMRRDGDLDGDGIEDVLIVHTPVQVTVQPAKPRALSIFRQDRNGALTQAVTNPNAIPCARCGGMFGDPLSAIDVRKGGFSIRLEGGSREMWSQVFDFRYVPEAGTWQLIGVRNSTLDRLDGGAGERALAPEAFGTVLLEEFDPSDFPIE